MILKCKMCGGDIELSQDKTFGTCEYCGSTMTFPRVDDEQRAAMFNRGNQFRRTGEFDKALAVYERIVQEDENDAEAHWCCALCRFGIEYVEDPNTLEYLPTCHRASFDSFLEDVDYLAALEHSDGVTKRQYQKDAQKIAEVQRGILATSQNEEPFDVFICYKESEDDGSRARDSLYAQDIYYQLTEQGRRVFFSRITLEDKAGTEYEPYIFAALNSAKVMILVTTSAEHANAVWVKNEWSRFLSLMRKDRSKLLLPCYRDMDPYDLPEALSVLQSYDMSKIGFIQDLIRGVNKVLNAAKPKAPVKETVRETVVVPSAPAARGGATPLLERAYIFLEDGNWQSADEYCEKVLDMEPKNAQAYVGKLMAELKVNRREQLKDQPEPFDAHNYYQKALRFGDDALKAELTETVAYIRDRNDKARKEAVYQKALGWMKQQKYREAQKLFDSISDYQDAAEQSKACLEKAETVRKDSVYSQAVILMKKDLKDDLERAIFLFKSIPNWKDANEKGAACQTRLQEIRDREEAYRQDRERRASEARIAAEKHKRNRTVFIWVVLLGALAIFVYAKIIRPRMQYSNATVYYESGEYEKAATIFTALGDYEDSAAKAKESYYLLCPLLIQNKNYSKAIAILDGVLSDYKDSKSLSNEAKYLYVADHKNNKDTKTHEYLQELKEAGYKDSKTIYTELYSWKATLTAVNDSSEDHSTILSSVSQYAPYLHFSFKVEGGEPGQSVTLTHRVIWPDGYTATSDWDWDDVKSGKTIGCEWTDGLNGVSAGKMTFYVYVKGTEECIGTASIQITAE